MAFGTALGAASASTTVSDVASDVTSVSGAAPDATLGATSENAPGVVTEKSVYFAAPLFSQAEKDFNLSIT